MSELRPLLRVSDVATATGSSEDTILRDINAGLLHALRRPKGRAFLIRPEAFEQYLKDIEHVPAGRRGLRLIGRPARRRRYSALVKGRA